MGVEVNGGPCRFLPGERLDVFALVIYVPDPLGRFLDDLRRELVPQCDPHAHVSVLPPRQLPSNWEAAAEQTRSLTEKWAPFELELTSVEIFPATGVIYIEIGRGAEELERLHTAMNTEALAYPEPYPYHPHITVAQEFPRENVAAVAEQARRCWAEYSGPRTFRAERAVFVRNHMDSCWVDLAEYPLGAVAV
jgi:2'-5' RNA ligase